MSISISKLIVLGAAAGLFLAGLPASVLAAQEKHSHEAPAAKYYCPMHPQVISDKPGDCPICHMRLVQDEPVQTAPSEKNPVEGRIPVSINPSSQAQVGIQTETVQQRELTTTIETWGEVAHDFELYELQVEFLREERLYYERTRDRTPVAQKRGVTEREKIAVKFQEMGLPPDWIDALEKSGVPDKRLIEHHEGAGIWIYLQVREKDAALVRPKDRVVITVPALPELKLEGHVEIVDGLVNMESKTIRVRLVIDESPLALKPNMSVSAKITVDLGKALTVSKEAPLFTGKRSLVFVEKDGLFSPREVVLGPLADGCYPVISGLSEGEKVSSSGNFFIDSESRLRASIAGVTHEGHAHD